MADISVNAQVVFEDGRCQKTAVYAVNGATGGDTFDVGPAFKVVKRAGLISATGSTVGLVSNAGTVLTVPAGPANDGVWVVVVGVAN